MSGKPLRHTMAKVEFLGCRDRIEEMTAQGFSKRIIYERLLEEKRLSMAYVTFCKVTARAAKADSSPPLPHNVAPAPIKATSPPPPAQQIPTSGPRIVNPAKEPFPDPRKMNLEDGI